MRGREREWDTVRDLLRDQDTGGIVLIEGERGVGKTLLLDEAAKMAVGEGYTVTTAAADELSQFVPMAPLLAVAHESPGTMSADRANPDALDTRMWMIGRIGDRLEEHARNGPLMVALDDLHWADPATLPALRLLIGQLMSHPVVWLLSRSITERRNGAGRLFALLEREGATRIDLRPLGDSAIAEIAADTLSAIPDADVLAMATGASGNPFLLIELLIGLVDEGAISVSGGRARVVSSRLPRRVQTSVHDRLLGLGGQTRQFIETGAVLGRSFTIEDLAEMLGKPPATLLAPLEEAITVGVLIATPEAIAFRHELVWKATKQGIPAPICLALHRHYGEMLVARGGSALPAAIHLLTGARSGDARALAGLDQAAAEVISSAPQVAAELAGRALELTAASAPDRLARTVTTIDALTAAGRLEESATLVRATLAGLPVDAPETARLHCTLSVVLSLRGQASEALAEAEAVLALPALPADLHDDAEIARLYALAGMHDNRRAADQAETVLTARDRHGAELRIGANLVLSLVKWDQGRLTEGLALAREAVREARGAPVKIRKLHPRMTLAGLLTDIHRLHEARDLTNESADEFDALGQVNWAAAPPVLRARMALVEGRSGDAAAEAQAGLNISAALETHQFSSGATAVLATVALRRGDLRAALNHLEDGNTTVSSYLAIYAEPRLNLVAAQVAEAAHGSVAAMARADEIYVRLPEQRWVLITNSTAAAWLVRVALSAGDGERARFVTETVEEIVRANPGFPTVATAAAHARGILQQDAACLGQAAKDHLDPWARASAAEDLGTLLAGNGHKKRAIEALEQSIADYKFTDAARDVARVRRRLRRLGVRHRHWKSVERPVAGWESLTETEGAISDLVSQGLTNQQIADRTFVSVHTVAFHLRQVFRKLQIRSRVELTRLAIERDQGPA